MRTLSGFLIVGILTALPVGAQISRPYGPAFGFSQVPNPQPVPGSSLGGVPGIRSGVYVRGLPAFSTAYPCPGCSPFKNHVAPGSGYPYGFGYVPFYSYFDSSEADTDANRQQAVHQNSAGDDPAFVMAEQIGEMRSEIKQLKSQASTENASAPALQPAIAPATETDDFFPDPATVIVLRNGSRFETENYAIMNGTLWNFSARPLQKIPLASIDTEASIKANAARGVDFDWEDSSE